MEVLVFKTSVTRRSQVSKVYSLLTSFADIKEVSVDLDDCDKVLRIVGVNTTPGSIISLVNSLGLSCAVLED